jgi:hypothetical protein
MDGFIVASPTANAAAPGAISLKKVSKLEINARSEMLGFAEICNPLIINQLKRAPCHMTVLAYAIGGATAARRSTGSVSIPEIRCLHQTPGEVSVKNV